MNLNWLAAQQPQISLNSLDDFSLSPLLKSEEGDSVRTAPVTGTQPPEREAREPKTFCQLPRGGLRRHDYELPRLPDPPILPPLPESEFQAGEEPELPSLIPLTADKEGSGMEVRQKPQKIPNANSSLA